MFEDDCIKINRDILDWGWYKDVNAKSLFFHCILKANQEDRIIRGIEVPAGSFISSVTTLVSETGMSEKAIRTAMQHLKKTGELSVKSTNKYSIITVNNYNCYRIDE